MDESHHRVLIVDDERTIAETLALVFSSGGYEAQTAYTAEQAVEIVAEWLPDLAIIDVVLPQTNGIDLAILLTAQCPACRVLLFSGEAVTDELEHFLAAHRTLLDMGLSGHGGLLVRRGTWR